MSESIKMSHLDNMLILLDAAKKIGCKVNLGKSGVIVLVDGINALNKRIAELEAEVAELKPYRDGYDGYDDYPEEGETVIARLRNWVFLAQHRGDYWYDALGYKEKIRGEVERWWKLPEEVQE